MSNEKVFDGEVTVAPPSTSIQHIYYSSHLYFRPAQYSFQPDLDTSRTTSGLAATGPSWRDKAAHVRRNILRVSASGERADTNMLIAVHRQCLAAQMPALGPNAHAYRYAFNYPVSTPPDIIFKCQLSLIKRVPAFAGAPSANPFFSMSPLGPNAEDHDDEMKGPSKQLASQHCHIQKSDINLMQHSWFMFNSIVYCVKSLLQTTTQPLIVTYLDLYNLGQHLDFTFDSAEKPSSNHNNNPSASNANDSTGDLANQATAPGIATSGWAPRGGMMRGGSIRGGGIFVGSSETAEEQTCGC
ncbi:unnamed protein product [Fusarium equiseti]|uniref:Uncharacterized protein n=1 Tax=Fusarium equiseti TaxID=61235 RepID=A0A8J2J2T6_FUSEQ|nr:unnamed protein product [Fusarium equiseti]